MDPSQSTFRATGFLIMFTFIMSIVTYRKAIVNFKIKIDDMVKGPLSTKNALIF